MVGSRRFGRLGLIDSATYCHAEALTKVGLLGIKVWICRGEVFGKKELAPNFTQSKESGRGNNSGNNGGKNFKRKKNNR